MNYLVTGANGYIGRYLCDELKKKHIPFRCPHRDELNLSDYDEVRGYIKMNHIKNIIHLAASIDTSDISDIFESNIRALYVVLRGAMDENIDHFTFVSTNNVYGIGYNCSILESDSCIPYVNNYYAISKYVGELMVADQMKDSPVGYAIARVADVYGPNQKSGELIKKVMQNIKSGTPQKIFGSGVRKRDYIYVEDVAKALVYISEHNLEGIYNVSTGIGTSVCELIKCADNIVACGIDQIEVQWDKEDKTSIVLDNGRLSREGYIYTVDIAEGLEKIINKI